MAITSTDSTKEYRSFSIGPVNIQLIDITAASGATSGTITASQLKRMDHIMLPNVFTHTAAPTVATNVATIAFTVPTSHTASKAIQDLTYTSVLATNVGNLISVAYTAGATAGAEVVTVTSKAISIQIETGVSTATQVRTAYNLSAAAVALASCAITGTGSNAQVTAAAAFLTGGVTGGGSGTALCIGV